MDPPHPPPPQFTGFPPFSHHQNHPNHIYQAPPPRPPPFSDCICAAIAALNEPNGSNKEAITSYIQSTYNGIPETPSIIEALFAHGVKTLMDKGILLEMVNNSYMFADKPKRGRGRPPKPKPDFHQQPNLNESIEETTEIKRPRGRPRKDGAMPTVKAAVTLKRRGRPPSGRAVGRERKPIVVSAPPASVLPYGVRRRGRPKRVDASVVPTNGEIGGEVVVKKRGRGRPPKVGGVNVIRKVMKLTKGYVRTGKPVGRPRKNAVSRGAYGEQDTTGYEEMKKKFELFQGKAKEIVNVLKAEIGGSENHLVVQAIHDLEELTTTTTMEKTDEALPQYMKPDEEHCETEIEGQGQTEAEAMQEALF